jgi:hypothetical protein
LAKTRHIPDIIPENEAYEIAISSRVRVILESRSAVCHDGAGDGDAYFLSRRGVCSVYVLLLEKLLVDATVARVWFDPDSTADVFRLIAFDASLDIEYSM